MNVPAHDGGRLALMLNELRLPTIGSLWPEFTERSDKEAWPAARLLGALLEHELAERAKRRIERHRAEFASGPDQDARRLRLRRRADGLKRALSG
ncbi:ATP-binding protein [Paraburkholderia sp. JHI2823]|uniref:ATP-binding protein n=1 Tax=Paraburkholderia sp. JHI2823 TaxID=3112960 RepID=UPI00317FA53D